MKNKWKTTAIIFIILFAIETLFLVYVGGIGKEAINNENKCSIEVCNLMEYNTAYDSYFYDSSIKMCYCYIDKEIVKSKYMGND